jgi:glucose-1-phosphate cytidylyltransferase
MKVVLFCGGLGLRLRENSESIPKPLVTIGDRPILWHLMKYYAHFGHKEFILCLGWKASDIKRYFLEYNECLSNDFVLSEGGNNVNLLHSDIHDWKITFVDTGIDVNIGQRLKAVQPYLQEDETFLVNYADGLTDLHLPDLLTVFNAVKPVGLFVSVRPHFNSWHAVDSSTNGRVTGIAAIGESDVWMNGGFFVFNRRIFDYIKDGEELVEEPFTRLINEGKLYTFKYDGFWACMDTFKEKSVLDGLYAKGPAPWEPWKIKNQPGRSLPESTSDDLGGPDNGQLFVFPRSEDL